MTGHGWVIPNPNGAVARCGGPGLCGQCAIEKRALEIWRLRQSAAPVQRIYPGDVDLANGSWLQALQIAKAAYGI